VRGRRQASGGWGGANPQRDSGVAVSATAAGAPQPLKMAATRAAATTTRPAVWATWPMMAAAVVLCCPEGGMGAQRWVGGGGQWVSRMGTVCVSMTVLSAGFTGGHIQANDYMRAADRALGGLYSRSPTDGWLHACCRPRLWSNVQSADEGRVAATTLVFT